MPQREVISRQTAEPLTEAHLALARSIARWTEKSPRLETEIPGLFLTRYEALTEPTSYMHEPSICMVAQGAKRVILGEETFIYDAYHFLITSIDLPVIAQVIEASAEKPYLGLMLKLDLKEVSQLIVDSNLPLQNTRAAARGIAVSEISLPLLNAFQRLLDLLDEPENIPILSPLAQREIFFRLLLGEQGSRLCQIAAAGSHSQQIARAIGWLKNNFSSSLRVDELAAFSGMSTSTFHHHFRAMTAMSPLQFQKWLRLHEARQLMLTERLDATSAAFQVGYESPSQFNREYNRLFGAPPLRDIKNLRQVAGDARALN
jgi:AraC-like DNA-binding protein